MSEFSENRVGNNSEEFLIANAIRVGRRRCLNMEMVLNYLVARRRRVLNACFIVYFIATKQHHSCVSLLSSVDQKHWMVGECLEQLFGGKIQENISDFSVNVQIHIKSHWPISC